MRGSLPAWDAHVTCRCPRPDPCSGATAVVPRCHTSPPCRGSRAGSCFVSADSPSRCATTPWSSTSGSGDKPSWRADVLLDRYTGAGVRRPAIRAEREARVSRPLFDADAADMPFADGAFDYAICSNLLEHVTDPEGVARRADPGRQGGLHRGARGSERQDRRLPQPPVVVPARRGRPGGADPGLHGQERRRTSTRRSTPTSTGPASAARSTRCSTASSTTGSSSCTGPGPVRLRTEGELAPAFVAAGDGRRGAPARLGDGGRPGCHRGADLAARVSGDGASTSAVQPGGQARVPPARRRAARAPDLPAAVATGLTATQYGSYGLRWPNRRARHRAQPQPQQHLDDHVAQPPRELGDDPQPVREGRGADPEERERPDPPLVGSVREGSTWARMPSVTPIEE